MLDNRIYYTYEHGNMGGPEREIATFYRHSMGICCGLKVIVEFDRHRGSQFTCDNPIDKSAACWVCTACQEEELAREGAADGRAASRTYDWDYGME